jgi:hypothetical protein
VVKVDKRNATDILKSFLSRKFICALVASIVAFGNSMWDWGLTPEQVLTVIAPLLAYIGIEGIADIKER